MIKYRFLPYRFLPVCDDPGVLHGGCAVEYLRQGQFSHQLLLPPRPLPVDRPGGRTLAAHTEPGEKTQFFGLGQDAIGRGGQGPGEKF